MQATAEFRQPQQTRGTGQRWSSAALYLAFAAIALRALDEYAGESSALPALVLLAVFLAVFAALPRLTALATRPAWLLHGCFLLAAAVVVALALLPPAPDFVSGLLVLLSFRAAYAFEGRALAGWIVLLSALVAGPLIYNYGLVWGLALALSSVVGCVVLPAYVLVNRQIEAARVQSELLVRELQAAHRQLQAYSAQAAELAAFEEHNRLSRELHDSVSQTLFSINLTASAARLLLAREPARARAELQRLQALTQGALADMRSFIAQLRPQTK